MDFEALLQTPRADGTYRIELIGDDLWAAELLVSVLPWSDDSLVQTARYKLEGIPIDKDSTVTFLFTYHSSPGGLIALTKVVTARSLLQDVLAMRRLNWILDENTIMKYVDMVNAFTLYSEGNDYPRACSTLTAVLQNIASDSSRALTSNACRSLRPDVDYLLRHVSRASSGPAAKLIDSKGIKLTSGSLQFYDSSWKDATNNGDGTFSVNTTLTSVSLRMTYEGGSQQKNNVLVGLDTVVFQTVNTQVKLQNSQGTLIDTGAVQYYAGSWRSFGTTSNGVATKELLPGSYSFRMTYAYGSNDKQQNIGTNPTVVFNTVNATVELRNSLGALIDQGTVQYYAGAWRSFGATTGGTVSKDLLPANYSFRMTNEYVSIDKAQNISANSTVSFSTVLCTIRVRNSQNQPVNGAITSYYSTAWHQIGPTANGEITKELLPANLTFRIVSGGTTQDKAQNLGTSTLVDFTTQ